MNELKAKRSALYGRDEELINKYLYSKDGAACPHQDEGQEPGDQQPKLQYPDVDNWKVIKEIERILNERPEMRDEKEVDKIFPIIADLKFFAEMGDSGKEKMSVAD